MQGGYVRRYRIKPRFYLVIGALLVLAVWLLLYVSGAFRQPILEWGALASDQTFTAIVLRDEQLITATEYSELSCVAAEGQAVAKDADVAVLYLSGYSKTDIKNLEKLRITIKDYQENNVLKSTVNAGLQDMNNKINDKMSQISAMAINRQTQNMAVAEAELHRLMQDRKAYMLEITNEDETLKRYYADEENLVNKINQTRKTIKSPADGLVSYYLDGFESRLTAESIAAMTPATIKELFKEITGKSVKFNSNITVQAGQAICRIVNPAKWYAVIVMNARENPFIEGIDYMLTFGGLQDTVSGKAIRVAAAGGNELIVLEISDGVPNMINLRIVNGHVGSDISGFRVPVDMFKEADGKAFIAVKDMSGVVKRIQVELVARDEKHVIIADVAGASELVHGLPLVKP